MKDYIIDNDCIPLILETLSCHHIQEHNGACRYYTCGNPDGDNPSAVTVYVNQYLKAINYTRSIPTLPKGGSDIFSLVEFYRECSFFEAVKYVCITIGLDIYHDFDEDVPESIKITKMLLGLNGDFDTDDDIALKPISERVLTYYETCFNDLFEKDNISAETQFEFEVGYDAETNRITIPIRDELGTLVGVKGRWLGDHEADEQMKYMYIEPCAKGQILYGLCKSYDFIKGTGKVFVCESEKAVMQLFEYGYPNCVACGGSKVTKVQIDKITRLCVDVIFVFDKDVKKSDLEELASRFTCGTNVYALIDTIGVLTEKMSPTDDPIAFAKLIKEGMVRLC